MLASICQPPTYPARNAFALFRRRFDLTDVPDTAPFHLFADTRYRLSVNGTIIGSGPTRFYPGFPPYDSHDIAPYLRAGENEIRVEVNHRGASSFQAVPSQLGFVAWDDWGAGLGTPGAWQSKVSRAWNADAPAFSFAQGPIEILNAAALEAEWQNKSGWQTPILAPDAWGELEPRSVPNVPNRVLPAPAMAQCAALSDAETFVGFARVCDDDARAKSPRDRFAVALVLDSPRAQTVELGLFWGDNTLNGVALQAHKDEQLGNRQNASAHLRAGENLLWAEVEALMPSWGFCLAWPTASGVTLNGPMRTSALMAPDALGQRRGDVPISPDDVASFDWLRPLDEFATSAFPARQVAWETPARALAELGWQNAPLLQSGAAVALWDFQKTVLGHVRFEIECEAETTVDVTLDERLRADGLLDVYGSNPFVNGTDRYVLAAGTHQIEGYHPRGGRYLQLNVRSEGAVQLRDLSLRSAVTHLGEQGDFRCSDPLLNQIWELGRATVEACWPDVWVDCPWREQGAYVGDTLVEFGAAQMLSSDRQTMRRALQLWAQGQREDGQMPSCVPAWMLSSHADFTLIYILALRDYFAATGDADLVRELWPHVEKIWDSPRWKSGDGVLWDADAEMHLFIDLVGAARAKAGTRQRRAQCVARRRIGSDSAVGERDWPRRRALARRARARCRGDAGAVVARGVERFRGVCGRRFARLSRQHLGAALRFARRRKRFDGAIARGTFDVRGARRFRGARWASRTLFLPLRFRSAVRARLARRGADVGSARVVADDGARRGHVLGAIVFGQKRRGQFVSRVELRADLVFGPRSVGLASGLRATKSVHVRRARLRFGVGAWRVSAR